MKILLTILVAVVLGILAIFVIIHQWIKLVKAIEDQAHQEFIKELGESAKKFNEHTCSN